MSLRTMITVQEQARFISNSIPFLPKPLYKHLSLVKDSHFQAGSMVTRELSQDLFFLSRTILELEPQQSTLIIL